jgi:hypothetical protein
MTKFIVAFRNFAKSLKTDKSFLFHAKKAYGEAEVEFHSFLASILDGGEWLTSNPGRFTPGFSFYLLNRRLGGPQRREKFLLILPGLFCLCFLFFPSFCPFNPLRTIIFSVLMSLVSVKHATQTSLHPGPDFFC